MALLRSLLMKPEWFARRYLVFKGACELELQEQCFKKLKNLWAKSSV